MADITWADVSALAPELATLPQPAQDILLPWANAFLNPAMFTAQNLRLARIYLVAHVATQSTDDADGQGDVGSITSEDVGGVNRTYAAIATTLADGSLDGSVYGQVYQLLIRTSRGRVGFVTGCGRR